MASLLAAAVVISRGNLETLERTLTAIANQTHPLMQVVVVEQTDSDECVELTKSFGFGAVSIAEPDESAGIKAGVTALQSDANWLWILHHDSAPEPEALKYLARAAEISPSVAIIGPKQLDWNHPIQIRQLGLTTTRTARPFTLVEDEYDQGQYDASGDTMAVSTAGMLVAMGLWQKIGGLNASSPGFAQDIEFCIKARALGYRVVVEPKAKVHSKGSLTSESHSSKKIFGGRAQALAKAHVHLATIMWPGWLLPFLYLSMPLVVAASIPLNLLQKRPARILGQVSAWLFSWFTISKRLAARKDVRQLGSLSSLDKLFATREQLSQRRSRRFEEEPEPETKAKGLLESGGLWFSIVPLVAGFALFPQGAIQRAGLGPLSRSFESVWANVSSQTQSYLGGAALPSDPFNWLLALIALVSPTSPSAGLAWYLFIAPMLLFIGSWYLFGLFTQNGYLKNAASLAVSLSMPIALTQRDAGVVELTAVVFAVWSSFFLAKSAFAFNLSRAWRWLGLAGLAGAAVAVSSPMAFAFLILLSIALGVQRVRRLGVLIWFALPGLALLWPWMEEVVRANRFELLTATSSASLGAFNPYQDPLWLFTLLVAGSVALIAAIARPGYSLALWLFAIAMLYASSYQPIASSQALTALVLLVLAAIVVMALDKSSDVLRLTGIWLLMLAGAGNLTLGLITPRSYSFVQERQVPALVMAASDIDPATRTLFISQENDGFEAELIWGDQRQLDETSLLARFIATEHSTEALIAQLAASLVAGNPEGVSELLSATGVDFVLLDSLADPSIQIALDSMLILQASGQTDFGLLWRVVESNQTPVLTIDYFAQRELQLATLAGFLLLAIPTPGSITGRRLRRSA